VPSSPLTPCKAKSSHVLIQRDSERIQRDLVSGEAVFPCVAFNRSFLGMGKKCICQAGKKSGIWLNLAKPEMTPCFCFPNPSGFVKKLFTCAQSALGELDVSGLHWHTHSRILGTHA